jgi:hypothetical protein
MAPRVYRSEWEEEGERVVSSLAVVSVTTLLSRVFPTQQRKKFLKIFLRVGFRV